MSNFIHKQDSYYAATRSDMVRFIDLPPTTLLEIGCGTGNFANNFPNVEYWGIEPNAEMAKRASAVAGRKILCGTYEAVAKNIPDDYFDIVVCNDVIEHLLDPIGFLTDIQRKLHSQGKLVASIPNIRYAPFLFDLVFRGEFEYAESGLLDYTHLHFFTHKSFKKMALQCGWKVELLTPLAIQPFKPLKNLVLKILECGRHDMRNIQFAVRLSRADSNRST